MSNVEGAPFIRLVIALSVYPSAVEMAWDLAVAISPVITACSVESASVANASAFVIASDFLVSAYVSEVLIAAVLAVLIAELRLVTSVAIAESVYPSAVEIAAVTAVERADASPDTAVILACVSTDTALSA